MQYLTYTEYTAKGGTLDSTAFNRNIDRACSIIDNATYKRVEAMANVPEQVKALCRDLVEFFIRNSETEPAVSGRSQSAGNVSQSESYKVKTKEEQNKDIDNMICDYLLSVEDDNGTPLLYRGCSA